MAQRDPHIPTGPLADKWRKHKTEIKLVNPANKRKYEVIVVGAGLAGSSAAATLAELGYKVSNFEGLIDFELRDAIRDIQGKAGQVPDGYPGPVFLQTLYAEGNGAKRRLR